MRKINIDDNLITIMYEACISYESELRGSYQRKNNFVQGLIGGHPEIPTLKKELDELERKIDRLHKAKFLFSYQEEYLKFT